MRREGRLNMEGECARKPRNKCKKETRKREKQIYGDTENGERG